LRENVAAHCKVMGHSTVRCEKAAEPIEIRDAVSMKTRVGPRHGGADTPRERDNFWGLSGPFKSTAIFVAEVAAACVAATFAAKWIIQYVRQAQIAF